MKKKLPEHKVTAYVEIRREPNVDVDDAYILDQVIDRLYNYTEMAIIKDNKIVAWVSFTGIGSAT